MGVSVLQPVVYVLLNFKACSSQFAAHSSQQKTYAWKTKWCHPK